MYKHHGVQSRLVFLVLWTAALGYPAFARDGRDMNTHEHVGAGNDVQERARDMDNEEAREAQEVQGKQSDSDATTPHRGDGKAHKPRTPSSEEDSSPKKKTNTHDNSDDQSLNTDSPAKNAGESVFQSIMKRFLTKLDELRHLDEDNALLRERVAVLELANARLEAKQESSNEEMRAEKLRADAEHEGGSVASRTIASLKSSNEGLLSRPPKVIFEGGLEAFNAEDYETAGKAFSFLVENKENDAYQNPRTFFLAGVSLYNMANYRKAKNYFERAAVVANGDAKDSDVSYAPRALAWVALCLKRLGDEPGVRRAVHELIQKYPKSKEARRLNRRNDA